MLFSLKHVENGLACMLIMGLPMACLFNHLRHPPVDFYMMGIVGIIYMGVMIIRGLHGYTD